MNPSTNPKIFDDLALNPSEFAWSSVQAIANKNPKSIKVIIDDIEYPSLERDSIGYVIHLSAPRRVSENLYSLHGLFFDNDLFGKTSLWRMFRASLYHLSLHSAITDYSIYKNITSKYSFNNAMFAISMAEDFAIRAYTRSKWPGLILDAAFANHISALRFRDLTREKNAAYLMAANLLSYELLGKPVVSSDDQSTRQLESIHAYLVDYSAKLTEIYSTKILTSEKNEENEAKILAAESIGNFFEDRSLYLEELPCIPYTDCHGPNTLFSNSIITLEPEQRTGIFRDALSELSATVSSQKIEENEKIMENEASSIFADWDYAEIVKQRLIDSYRGLDPSTHFEQFGFPKEDYAQFVRTRSKVIGPIRRVLEQLRMLKTSADEVNAKESGYVDIQAAIQVIASNSTRNDVFIRDENDKKSESWSILIDSSKSLENTSSQVSEIAICLAEVAKDLIPDQGSWGMYSFDQNFQIVKDFSENYGIANKARIGGIKTGLKTYLPDAITLASRRLATTSTDVKVLLVASDGFPLGYEGIDEALVDAIDHVKEMGVQLIGLGIGSSLISKHFRSNCVIHEPFDFMKHFVRTYYELSSSF